MVADKRPAGLCGCGGCGPGAGTTDAVIHWDYPGSAPAARRGFLPCVGLSLETPGISAACPSARMSPGPQDCALRPLGPARAGGVGWCRLGSRGWRFRWCQDEYEVWPPGRASVLGSPGALGSHTSTGARRRTPVTAGPTAAAAVHADTFAFPAPPASPLKKSQESS